MVQPPAQPQDSFLAGCVVDDSGQPIADATVYVAGTTSSPRQPSDPTCPEPPEPFLTATCTDTAGNFTLDVTDLPTTTANLTVVAQGFQVATTTTPFVSETTTQMPACIVMQQVPPQAQQCALEVSFTRGAAPCERVDVFFAIDDTSSFEQTGPVVASILGQLVTDLQSQFPGIDFAFGVGRFEDYGGPGTGPSDQASPPGTVNDSFSFASTPGGPEFVDGRPWTLNQAILETSATNFSSLMNTALNDLLPANLTTASGATVSPGRGPGFGGDVPETALEALNQVATGAGFDGNGNGSTNESGLAGNTTTQQAPGNSGDVPAFSELDPGHQSSGTLGGVGWRQDTCRIVILTTDACWVAGIAGTSVPTNLTGVNGVTINANDFFNCSGGAPGEIVSISGPTGPPLVTTNRFGFVSDSKSKTTNTVTGAAVPAGAATLQATVDALNSLGIKVIGLTNQLGQITGLPPTPPGSPIGTLLDPSIFGGLPGANPLGIPQMQAMAILTGAVDGNGTPLVYPISGVQQADASSLLAAISDAISAALLAPIDVNAVATSDVDGDVVTNPTMVLGVGANQTATFRITVDASTQNLTVSFRDAASGSQVGTINAVSSGDCQFTLVTGSQGNVSVTTVSGSGPATGTGG